MKESLDTASKYIKEGGVILCPTDTIYGLSCDAKDLDAIERIREIKGRDQSKSFIVLVNSDRLFNQCTAEIPEVAWDLIDNADSPLTLVVPASNFLPEILRPNQMVAVRFVKGGFIGELLNKVNRPIVSTSANLSGQDSPKTFSDIHEKIKNEVDFVVDPEHDNSDRNKASKIILLKENGEVQILRK